MEKLQGLNKLVMETDESLEIQKAFEKLDAQLQMSPRWYLDGSPKRSPRPTRNSR